MISGVGVGAGGGGIGVGAMIAESALAGLAGKPSHGWLFWHGRRCDHWRPQLSIFGCGFCAQARQARGSGNGGGLPIAIGTTWGAGLGGRQAATSNVTVSKMTTRAKRIGIFGIIRVVYHRNATY